MTTTQVLCQQWEESEKDWGVRPDGYSLHATESDRIAFIEMYWAGMPDTPPSEYSRPCGRAYVVTIEESVAEELAASTHGVRYYSRPTPQPPANTPGTWRTLGGGISGLV